MVFAGLTLMISGCQHINVAQITYEMLRADDCRRNQLEDFCARNYASDYHDYIKLRNDFLRSQDEEIPVRYVPGELSSSESRTSL